MNSNSETARFAGASHGMLELYIKVGASTPRGGTMFMEAVNSFGSWVRGIRASWRGGGDLASNYDAYKAAIHSGLPAEQAAFKTFTGEMAKRAGFTKARIVPTNDPKHVVVEFVKQ